MLIFEGRKCVTPCKSIVCLLSRLQEQRKKTITTKNKIAFLITPAYILTVLGSKYTQKNKVRPKKIDIVCVSIILPQIQTACSAVFKAQVAIETIMLCMK